jgi:hypothetical protein
MIKIIIETNPRFSWWRHLLGFSAQTVPIGVGVWWGSEPLQWLGLVCSVLFLLGIAVWIGKRDFALTIDQARRRLDEIERDDRGPRR